MSEPLFLEPEQVLQLHRAVIEAHGGDPGVRDWGLLESAVAMPRQAFGGRFVHESLPAMAAAYLFHIVRNRAFVDGNKRVGCAAALVFLDGNGMYLDSDPSVLEDLTVRVASGTIAKAEVIEFFETHVKPLG